MEDLFVRWGRSGNVDRQDSAVGFDTEKRIDKQDTAAGTSKVSQVFYDIDEDDQRDQDSSSSGRRRAITTKDRDRQSRAVLAGC